jgi:uncharacterized protein involved in exopolysaccharide biosynthesis
MAQGGKIDLRRLLQIAKRWKWLLIAPPIAVAIGAYAYIATTPPSYTSTSTIVLGTNQYVMPEMVAGAQRQGAKRMVDMKENITAQLLSQSCLSEVIKRSGITPSQGLRERAQEILKKQPDGKEADIIRKLQTDWLAQRVESGLFFPRRGNYFQVSITHTDPEMAYALTKNLADVFIEESLLAEGVGPRETLEFTNQQLEIYAKQLEEARERLRQFRTGLVREKTRNLDVNVQNESQISAQIKAIQVDIATKQRQLRDWNDQLGPAKEKIAIQFSPKANDLRGQLIEKISNVAVLMVQLSWRDPQIIKVNQDIADLREQLQQEIQVTSAGEGANGFSPQALGRAVQRQMVLTDLEMLNRQKSVLENLIQKYKQSLTQQPGQDLEESQLQSEVDNLQQKVAMLQEQAQALQMRQALQSSDSEVRYKIQDPANRPITPTTADQQKILIMSFFGGLGLGVGLVYLIEFFDHSFKSVDEVEQALGLTVLGTVPKLDFGENRPSKREMAFKA